MLLRAYEQGWLLLPTLRQAGTARHGVWIPTWHHKPKASQSRDPLPAQRSPCCIQDRARTPRALPPACVRAAQLRPLPCFQHSSLVPPLPSPRYDHSQQSGPGSHHHPRGVLGSVVPPRETSLPPLRACAQGTRPSPPSYPAPPGLPRSHRGPGAVCVARVSKTRPQAFRCGSQWQGAWGRVLRSVGQ